jgi:hypothetical protein
VLLKKPIKIHPLEIGQRQELTREGVLEPTLLVDMVVVAEATL